MPYCSKCRLEYEEAVVLCTDCGAALSPGWLPPDLQPQGEGEEKWAVLMRVRSEDGAEIVRGLLESAGVECEVIDKTLSEMPVPAVERLSYLEVWVPEAQLTEARAVLNDAREGTLPCPSCGHMSSVEDPSCEYCGAPVGT